MAWPPRQLTRSVPWASTVLSRCRASPLTTPIEAVAFWAAVCLPALYVPLLFLGARSTVASLIALHAVALALGHPYKREVDGSG